MAFRTLPLGNGGMGHVKDDTSVVGAMRVVAGNAVLIPDRVIHVRSFESEFLNLMTLFTERRSISFQQEIEIGRRMGDMAVETTFTLVQRSVPESNLTELCAHILVAVETKVTA